MREIAILQRRCDAGHLPQRHIRATIAALMRSYSVLFACLLALLAIIPLHGARAAERVALIVANADYSATTDLANPPADSALVAEALRQAGFDRVITASDLDFTSFQSTLREFRDAARGADTALLYYAGHGIEGRGQNWLVPVDAGLEREGDLPYEAIELQLAMDALEGAQLKIAVLDACRNNPFAGNWTGGTRSVIRGLAPVEFDDILVLYAAAPGMVAFDGADGNSPFALSLARRIVQPGLPVQLLGGMVRDDVLEATEGEQRPFISASITGRPIYLVGGPETPPVAAPTPAPTTDTRAEATVDPDAEQQAWEAALKLDTVSGYRDYLSRHPEGSFAPFAEANITQLLDPTATGGETNSDPPWLLSFKSALPDRYAVTAGEALPIDGVWRLSTNGKRMRFDRGRAFAVDGWNFSVVFRVQPDQVTMVDIRQEKPGVFIARDILLNADSELTLREDGNLDVRVATWPLPTKFVMIREGLDSEGELDAQQPAE